MYLEMFAFFHPYPQLCTHIFTLSTFSVSPFCSVLLAQHFQESLFGRNRNPPHKLEQHAFHECWYVRRQIHWNRKWIIKARPFTNDSHISLMRSLTQQVLLSSVLSNVQIRIYFTISVVPSSFILLFFCSFIYSSIYLFLSRRAWEREDRWQREERKQNR